VSWDQQFDDPIVLPGRKPLVTPRDAALYITKLPKAEHDADERQAAMEALLLVAERNGPTMLARIRMMRDRQPSYIGAFKHLKATCDEARFDSLAWKTDYRSD
jgi:hypothetical protein